MQPVTGIRTRRQDDYIYLETQELGLDRKLESGPGADLRARSEDALDFIAGGTR